MGNKLRQFILLMTWLNQYMLGRQEQQTVPAKEETLFEIFQDGEGLYSARHKSGDWLQIGSGGKMELFSERNKQRYEKLELLNRHIEAYIKQRELKYIGKVTFIKDGI